MEKYTDIDLTGYNSFGIAARARRLVEFASSDELADILTELRTDGSKWDVIGGGNNILFTEDYEGTLLRPSDRSITVLSDDGRTVKVRAGAAVEWDDFVAWSVDNELWGAENLSLIPGFVGSAPVQNIGAYGTEVKDITDTVEALSTDTGKKTILHASHCGFGYRDSVFKNMLKKRAIITSVNFVLRRDGEPDLGYGELNQRVTESGGASLRNIRDTVIAIRNEKLPDTKVLGNAGSFFKNPVVDASVAQRLKNEYPSMPLYPSQEEGRMKLAAGWLIDNAGWKGRRVGDAGVHEKQALVLVNYGGATGRDILALSDAIRADVKTKYGVDLVPEVNIW